MDSVPDPVQGWGRSGRTGRTRAPSPANRPPAAPAASGAGESADRHGPASASGASGAPGPTPAPRTALEELRRLESGPRGLVEAEAERRLGRYGENSFPGRRSPSRRRCLARSLRDPFTVVLLCLGLVSALIASWGTACVIAVLVTASCLLRAGGEYRADRSMAALRELVAGTATVQRRLSEHAAPYVREIPVDQLVPGDVVRLAAGDLVPADVRLLRATGLSVHQAALTGESAPVPKHPVDAPAELPPGRGLFAQPQLCFQGSSVASGSGTAVVVATGGDTRFADAHGGSASGGSAHGGSGRRAGAFDRLVNGVAWILIRFMLLTPPLVLAANAGLRGRGLETLPFAVAVAVGLTPEMLPVVVATALARGAAVLARGGEVIVKRLPALHDLGAADVLCTDKTGTLTEGRAVLDCSLDAEGRPRPDVADWAAVNSLCTLQLADPPAPDTLDEALLEAAGSAADGSAGSADGSPIPAGGPCSPWEYDGVAALPFDPAYRSSCAVVRTPGRPGRHTLVVKGAVEDVLERCSRLRGSGGEDVPLDGARRAEVLRRSGKLAEEGLRLLAVAVAERPARPRAYTRADERGLTFLGFVGLRDALAPGAADALAALSRYGVAVKVLTGDHPGTAARVCRDLGMEPGPGSVVTGDRIDRLDDAELAEVAAHGTLFARCGPDHKARVVRALRERGRTTGFLGDGVNDLPAMHAADVGLCPREAVPVTREAADMVLAAKDMAVIAEAIAVGRRSSGNIASYLRIVLSSNLGNVIAMLVAGLLLPFLPMYPAQVLLQNLCFDATQLAFAFDRPCPSALRAPTVLRARALLRFITGFGLLNAVADLTTFAVMAAAVPGSLAAGGQAAFHAGWFTENLLTQAMMMLLLRTGRGAARRPGRRAPGPVRCAVAGLALTGVLLPLSPLGPALGMTPLPAGYHLLLALVLGLFGLALTAARVRYERRCARRAPQEC